MTEFIDWVSQPWPWYVAGPIIGLMVPLHLMLLNRMFGITSSFRHICGIIGSAAAVSTLSFWTIRKVGAKSIEGNVIELEDKAPNYKSACLGGTLFGLSWAMIGACAGPMCALVRSGKTVFIVSMVTGIVSVLAYSALRPKLPR